MPAGPEPSVARVPVEETVITPVLAIVPVPEMVPVSEMVPEFVAVLPLGTSMSEAPGTLRVPALSNEPKLPAVPPPPPPKSAPPVPTKPGWL